MDRKRRASSAASKSLLSRQLASITDTLAKASQRRDEEVERSRRTLKASTAATNPASPTEPAVSVQKAEPAHEQPEPAAVQLRGGGDDKDPHATASRLEEWERAEESRKERKSVEQMVASSGADDAERKNMIAYLVARERVAKTAEEREVERKRLEEEEEAVDEVEKITKREKEVEELEELLLREEEEMENENYEERVRRWEEERRRSLRERAKEAARNARNAFLVDTAYAAQSVNPKDETAELQRLEEEIFEHLVARMEAEDARLLEEERKRQWSEATDDDARKEVKVNIPSERSTAPGLANEHGDEPPEPATVQLRGEADPDDEAADPAMTLEDAEAERKHMDFQEIMAMVKALDAEREAQEEATAKRDQRRKAARTSGHASDEKFERMIAKMEAEDTKRLEEKIRYTEEMKQKRAEGAAGKSKATDRAPSSAERAAERSYLLPPDSPPKSPPPSYEVWMRGGEASLLDDDPRALLAELRSLKATLHLPDAQNSATAQDGDGLRQVLAEFDRSVISIHAPAAGYDDPRQMLAELATLSALGHRDVRSPANEDHEDDEDDDISMLRARLERLRSSCETTPLTPAPVEFDGGRTQTATPALLDPESIPYVVALELEHSKCPWEHAQGWTRCLFSSGLDSYEAQQKKESAVAAAEEAFQKIIKSVMEVEEKNQRQAEETKLQRRLIVTNLAAGADKAEVERQFWKHRCDIVDTTLLPDRDPLKRTQTGYVDFSSRKTAIQASYMSGQVYGLIFDVKLAVPVEQAPVRD